MAKSKAATPPVDDGTVEGAEVGIVGQVPSITQTTNPALPVAEMPQGHEPRKTVPQAPKQTSGDSAQVIARIRNILQAVGFKRDVTRDDYLLAISDIEATPTLRTHPEVAGYKAECLDYLRGKL